MVELVAWLVMIYVHACILGNTGGRDCRRFILDSGAQMSVLPESYGYPPVGTVVLQGFDPVLGGVAVPVAQVSYLIEVNGEPETISLPSAIVQGAPYILSAQQLVSQGLTVDLSSGGAEIV